MQPRSAHQPKYTLPRPLEVCQKPLKYGHLHTTDTQQWSQQFLLLEDFTLVLEKRSCEDMKTLCLDPFTEMFKQ